MSTGLLLPDGQPNWHQNEYGWHLPLPDQTRINLSVWEGGCRLYRSRAGKTIQHLKRYKGEDAVDQANVAVLRLLKRESFLEN